MHSQRHLPMGKNDILRGRAVPPVIACLTSPFLHCRAMRRPSFNLEVVGTVLSVPVILSFVNPRPRKRRTRPPCGPSRFEVLGLDYSFGIRAILSVLFSTCQRLPFRVSSNSWALSLLLRAFYFPPVFRALPITDRSWLITTVSTGALSRQSR